MPVVINSGLEQTADGEILVPEAELTVSAPKYEVKRHRLVPPQGISPEDFRLVLSGAYQQYLFRSDVSVKDVVKITDLPEEVVTAVFMSSEFQRGMELRGISVSTNVLTQKMHNALLVLTDHTDGLTLKQKLKKANITSAEYQAFLRNREFSSAMSRASEGIVSNSQEALLQLGRLVGEGNLQAIKLQMEISKRYNPHMESAMGQRELMVGLMDIIYRNVKDKEVLEQISEEMLLLSAKMEGNTKVIGS